MREEKLDKKLFDSEGHVDFNIRDEFPGQRFDVFTIGKAGWGIS